MAKLKAALLNAQHASAQKAAKAKHEQAKLLKHKSITGATKSQRVAGKRKVQVDELGRLEKGNKAPATASSATRKRQVIPFEKDDTILLIGEGNFSFATSLLAPPHAHPAHLVLATAYDSEAVCYEKYPDAAAHVDRIRRAGGRVEFGVDAAQLSKCKAIGKEPRWSRIVFNFPHAGAGIKDQDRNILTNQHLILSFLRACPPLLTRGKSRLPVDPRTGKKAHKHKQAKRRGGERDDDDDDEPEGYVEGGPADEVSDDENMDTPSSLADAGDAAASADEADASAALATALSAGEAKLLHPPAKQGTVLITLKNKLPYTLWDVHHLATRPPAHPVRVRAGDAATGKQPRYTLLRSFPFDPAAWPGYEHRRTLGFKEGVSKGANAELLKGKEDEGRGECRTWEFEPRYERR
ncbi:hypothetical protein NCC49_005592 [Naganishia albida]|nr:hypothetical protein NCC49_005592 [Naganishia albida]